MHYNKKSIDEDKQVFLVDKLAKLCPNMIAYPSYILTKDVITHERADLKH